MSAPAFAEPETGAEAYIPLSPSPSRRARNTAILSEAARRFGRADREAAAIELREAGIDEVDIPQALVGALNLAASGAMSPGNAAEVVGKAYGHLELSTENLSAALAASIPKPTAVAKASRLAFRPWGTDSMADVIEQNERLVTIAYDHEPEKRYTIRRHELANIGRFVNREAYVS